MFPRIQLEEVFKASVLEMGNLWVHPELKAGQSGFGRISYADRLRLAYQMQKRNREFHTLVVPLFLACFLVIVPFSLGLVVLKSSTASTVVKGFVDRNFPGLATKTGQSAKADYLARLSYPQKREFQGQMAYISKLIGKIRPRADADDLARIIVTESHKAGFDPFYTTAVIMAESTFNTRARSSVGALGLMQLLPPTAKYVSKMNGFDWKGKWELVKNPAYNIRLGIAYFQYLEREHDLIGEHALMAYNWGPGNVARYLKNQKRPPKVTRRYAKKILGLHKNWSTEYASKRTGYQYLNVGFSDENVKLALTSQL